MKTAFFVVAIAAVPFTADAQTTRSSCGTNFMGTYTCTTDTFRDAPSTVGQSSRQARKEQAESGARDAQWEAYCEPKIVQGLDGIDRYQYARPGCEYGKHKP